MRRWEILLPLQFNDGSAVPREMVGEVIVFIRERFEAVSFETQTIRGVWQHEGHVYQDSLVRLFTLMRMQPCTSASHAGNVPR